MTISASPQDDLAAWHEQRRAAVTAPAGNLALVEYVPVEGVAESMTIEGLLAERADGMEGVYVTPPDGATVAVDGEPMSGRTFVGRLQADGHPLVTVDRFTFDVFSLDGSDYELRIYDPESEHLRTFSHIENYPYNAEAVFTGHFAPYADTAQVEWGFTRASDDGHKKQVPGTLAVEIGDRRYELLAFLNGPQMVLVYADGTTGSESYAPGKFLAVPAPDADGAVTLDFNRSFIPPCGFSYAYSCPIPPPQNKIEAPLPAGEMKVVYTEPH